MIILFCLFLIKLILSQDFFECNFGGDKNLKKIEIKKIFRYFDYLIIQTPESLFKTKIPIILKYSSRTLFINSQPVLLDKNYLFNLEFQKSRVSYYDDKKNSKFYYYFPDYDENKLYLASEYYKRLPLKLFDFPLERFLPKNYTIRLFYYFKNQLIKGMFFYSLDNVLSIEFDYNEVIFVTKQLKINHTVNSFIINFLNAGYNVFDTNILIELREPKSLYVGNFIVSEEFDYNLQKINFETLFFCSNYIKHKKNLRGIFYFEKNFFIFFDFYYIRLEESYLKEGFKFSKDVYDTKKKIVFENIDNSELYFENLETIWIRREEEKFYLLLPKQKNLIDFSEKLDDFKLIYLKDKDKIFEFDCIKSFINLHGKNYCFEEYYYYPLDTEKRIYFEIRKIFEEKLLIKYKRNEELILFFDYIIGEYVIMMTNIKIMILKLSSFKIKDDLSLYIDFTDLSEYRSVKNCIFFETCLYYVPEGNVYEDLDFVKELTHNIKRFETIKQDDNLSKNYYKSSSFLKTSFFVLFMITSFVFLIILIITFIFQFKSKKTSKSSIKSHKSKKKKLKF